MPMADETRDDDDETREFQSTPPPAARRSSVAPMESGELRLYEDAGVGVFKGARILLAFDDPGRSDSLAQELRALHAVVVVSGRTEQGLLRARDLDPEVVLVDKDTMVGGIDLNELIRNDTRLRWAAIVVVRWEDIYPNENGVAHMDRIASRIAPHRRFEELLSKMPADKDQFDVPLERVGPARLIRAMGQSNASVQVIAQTAQSSLCDRSCRWAHCRSQAHAPW
jgi:DNA-binding NarL/FixJ family response regulator